MEEGKRTSILLVVAMVTELEGILDVLTKGKPPIWEKGAGRQAVWETTLNAADKSETAQLTIALCGVLEHNAVSLTAKLLHERPHIVHVINFGCVGAVEGRSMNIGDWAFVRMVQHYDVMPTFQDWAPSIKLNVPFMKEGNYRTVTCSSGARFTLGEHGCDCEDMEIYGLASLCGTLGLQISSIKYAANFCNEDGEKDYQKNVVSARAGAQEGLLAYLRDLSGRLH